VKGKTLLRSPEERCTASGTRGASVHRAFRVKGRENSGLFAVITFDDQNVGIGVRT
jgi:hypothetical protein